MAYDQRFEPTPGWIMDAVVAATQPYLGGEDAYGTGTSPTLAQVESTIDRGVSQLAVRLEKCGYAAEQPVDDVGTDVATFLSNIVLYGTLKEITLGKANAVLERGQRNVWEIYQKQYEDMLMELDGATLEYMGAARSRPASQGLELRGADWREQQDLEDDYDYKGAVFPRDQFSDDERRRFDREDFREVEPGVTR